MSGKKNVCLIRLTAAFLILLMVLYAGCVKQVTVNDNYDVSYVCENPEIFQGNLYLKNEITENNETILYIQRFDFVNGIVVFSNYNNEKDVGLIIITGKYQIVNNETAKKYLAISVREPAQIRAFNVGSIVTLQNSGIKWQNKDQEGKTYWFIDNPGINLIKTGEVQADDPIYDDVQNAIHEFNKQRNSMESMNLLLIYYAFSMAFNPSMS